MPRVFFDLEFTSLHQHAQPLSLALITDSSVHTLYCEFTDYDPLLVTPWVAEFVLPKLRLTRLGLHYGAIEHSLEYKGTRRMAAPHIFRWLYDLWDAEGQHEDIEFWGDVLAYDWVLLCELLGGSQKLPQYVYYIPFDIATLMKVKGVDPDINRLDFVGTAQGTQHDALQDAATIALCYQVLMEMP